MKTGSNTKKLTLIVIAAIVFAGLVATFAIFGGTRAPEKRLSESTTQVPKESKSTSPTQPAAKDTTTTTIPSSGEEQHEPGALSDVVGRDLFAYLPHKTLNWEIDGRVDNNHIAHFTVYITGAILNRPEQRLQYEKDLAKFKQEALDWFQEKGQDPNKLDIAFQPQS